MRTEPFDKTLQNRNFGPFATGAHTHFSWTLWARQKHDTA